MYTTQLLQHHIVFLSFKHPFHAVRLLRRQNRKCMSVRSKEWQIGLAYRGCEAQLDVRLGERALSAVTPFVINILPAKTYRLNKNKICEIDKYFIIIVNPQIPLSIKYSRSA